MVPVADGTEYTGDVQATDSLESLIALSGGETGKIYRVMDEANVVGQLDMRDLVKALVPRVSSTKA